MVRLLLEHALVLRLREIRVPEALLSHARGPHAHLGTQVGVEELSGNRPERLDLRRELSGGFGIALVVRQHPLEIIEIDPLAKCAPGKRKGSIHLFGSELADLCSTHQRTNPLTGIVA